MKLENPVIVFKDRPYFDKNIEMDLGQIQVSSCLKNVEGKWKSYPKKKTYVNIIEIEMKDARMDYNSKAFCIMPPFDMVISMERINWSELLLDQFMSKGINFEEFDNGDKILIKSTALKFNFEKEIYTYFLQMFDLNINYYDMLAPGYQLFTWNSLDFMKYLDLEENIVETYKNTFVQRRTCVFQFPSFSLRINEADTTFDNNGSGKSQSQLLTELVLQNVQIDFKYYLDYRKDMLIRSKTFYILCKDKDNDLNTQVFQSADDVDCKSLIIGPMKSKRSIVTQGKFYNLLMDQVQFFNSHNIHANQGVMFDVDNKDLLNSDFELKIKMEADGAKVFEYEMKALKLFLKVDILQIISNFFSGNWPEYPADSKDLPTYHEADIGNYPRHEMVMNLNDCLICCEQMNDISKMNGGLNISQIHSPRSSQRSSGKGPDSRLHLPDNMMQSSSKK